jgi:tetratricopeptide (TPR) repeat protein
MHKNQLSSGSAMLQLMVKLIENSYNTLIQDPNTPSWVHELEPRMKAGIRLAMLPSLVQNAEDYLTAARLIHEAMSYAPDEKFLQRVCPPLMQSLLENEEYDILSTLCDAMESRNLLSDDLGLPKAQTYYKLGRFADAYECIKNTLKHCPFDPAAQMLFVELQHETRRQKQTGLHVETISNGDGAINIFNPGGMDLSQAAASKVRDGEFKR